MSIPTNLTFDGKKTLYWKVTEGSPKSKVRVSFDRETYTELEPTSNDFQVFAYSTGVELWASVCEERPEGGWDPDWTSDIYCVIDNN